MKKVNRQSTNTPLIIGKNIELPTTTTTVIRGKTYNGVFYDEVGIMSKEDIVKMTSNFAIEEYKRFCHGEWS